MNTGRTFTVSLWNKAALYAMIYLIWCTNNRSFQRSSYKILVIYHCGQVNTAKHYMLFSDWWLHLAAPDIALRSVLQTKIMCWMNRRHDSPRRMSYTSAFYFWCHECIRHSVVSVQADWIPSETAIQNPTKPHLTTIFLCNPSCHLNLKQLQRLQAVTNPPFFVFVVNKHPPP